VVRESDVVYPRMRLCCCCLAPSIRVSDLPSGRTTIGGGWVMVMVEDAVTRGYGALQCDWL